MKIFLNNTLTELKISTRNIVFLVFSVMMPILLIVLFGGLYGNKINSASKLFPLGAVNTSVPAYIALSLAIIALIGMPSHLVNYKENKILKRLKGTPIKSWQIIFPIFINFLIIFIIGTIFLFLTGIIFYDLKFGGNLFIFLFAIILSVTAMFSIGFLLFCLCTSVKQITAIGFSILIPLVFLSGATMPMSAFPETMSNVSKFIPLTYCVEFMQGTFLGESLADNWLSILVLLGITLTCVLLSSKFFKWE